jgi:glycopeptide antibiotics resistance protein
LQGLGVRKLRWVILIATIISYSIEFSQLLTKRGLFELFDDPFHNVLGAIIGFTLWRMIMKRCSEKSEGQAIRQK